MKVMWLNPGMYLNLFYFSLCKCDLFCLFKIIKVFLERAKLHVASHLWTSFILMTFFFLKRKRDMNANETSSRLKINPVFTADFSHRKNEPLERKSHPQYKRQCTTLTNFYAMFRVLHIISSASSARTPFIWLILCRH